MCVMFWGEVAWCPCASKNMIVLTIGVNIACFSEVLCCDTSVTELMFSSCLRLISGNSMAFSQQGFVEKCLSSYDIPEDV